MKRLMIWGGLAALLGGVVWYVYSDHYFTQRFDAAVEELIKYGDEVKSRHPANSAAEHFRKAMSTVGDELKRYKKELDLEKLTRRERIEKLKDRFHETFAPFALYAHDLPSHITAGDIEAIDWIAIREPEKLYKLFDIPTGSIDPDPPKESFIEKALERLGFD